MTPTDTYVLSDDTAAMVCEFADEMALQVSDPGVLSMSIEWEPIDEPGVLRLKVTRKGAKVSLPDGTKVPLDELLARSVA